MKKSIAKMTVKAARKNPRAALSVALFVVRHARGIRKAVRVTRRASRALGRARAVEPAVQRDLRAAAANLGDGLARLRKIGVVDAAGDKRVAKHFDKALRHVSDALGGVRKAKRPRNVRAAMSAPGRFSRRTGRGG
jgi:hypothetical protein